MKLVFVLVATLAVYVAVSSGFMLNSGTGEGKLDAQKHHLGGFGHGGHAHGSHGHGGHHHGSSSSESHEHGKQLRFEGMDGAP